MYKREVSLHHNETLVILDNDTGEIRNAPVRPNNIPLGKEIFESSAIFKKDYFNSWSFLRRELSNIELAAALGLVLLAKGNTNTLEPLNDETPIRHLSELLGVSKNKVTTILKKLFDIGVYGKFAVSEVNKPYSKYWIINPFLSFSGRMIQSDIKNLFINTHIAKAFYDPEYVYKKRIN